MFTRVVICLDGSHLAERMIPYAQGIAAASNARLKLLRVVDWGEGASGVKDYLDLWSKFLRCESEVLEIKHDVAATILGQFASHLADLPVITTRGHTGLIEPLLGSTALNIVRKIGRPILLMHPKGGGTATFEMKSIVALLDGSKHAEAILPFAAETAKAAGVGCELIQVLPVADVVPKEIERDIVDSAYIGRSADRLKRQFGVKVAWDVLHGHPASAVCSYISGRPGVVLAMTSHIRTPLQHAVLGSIASECLCRSGVPAFIYGLSDS
jgi:nucleotide-binding universal stress UspA family protein